MERIQLPWMSERYLFLLSYCTSSPTPAKRESFVFRPSKLTNAHPGMVRLFCLPFPASDIYQSKGIHKLHFLPTCPVGHEAQRVRSYQDSNPGTLATFGVVWQNVFVPALRDDPKLKVTAVASMFRRSPLCVASLGRGGGRSVIPRGRGRDRARTRNLQDDEGTATKYRNSSRLTENVSARVGKNL